MEFRFECILVAANREGFSFEKGESIFPCPRIDVKYFLILALITCIRTGLTIAVTENGRVIGSARAHPAPSSPFFFPYERAFNVYDPGPFIRPPIILLVHSSRRRMNVHRVDRHDSISQKYKLYLFIIHLVTRLLLFYPNRFLPICHRSQFPSD